VLGKDPKRLYVEDERFGSALRPQLGYWRCRQSIVGTIELDQTKIGRIMAKASLGGLSLLGIEQLGIDQGLVRPRGGADEKVAHARIL